MSVEIVQGDCLDVLATLEPDSFAACVTDPPYGLGFMARQWDAPANVAFRPETWEAVYRVLKPGAHLLAFGGTRTFHRLACAIEDAGFGVRDTIMWLYGSGFPKSHNVAVAIDRASGAPPRGKAFNMKGRGERAEELDTNGREFLAAYEAKTEAARAWAGWGTALKPAVEPIVVARKPLSEGTVAANVLRWGTGAINIDACRVESGGEHVRGTVTTNGTRNTYGKQATSFVATDHPSGRWPANVAHDGSPEVLAAFARFGESTSTGGDGYKNSMFCGGKPTGGHGLGDTGTAARFFFCGKATQEERCGSKHPTVKPVNLLRWLVTLITPPGGRVLDPFCGTGSTLVACDRLGFPATGIEQDAQSVADAHEKIRRFRARRAIGDVSERVAPLPGQTELGL